jgi:putative DNA primase/helicase
MQSQNTAAGESSQQSARLEPNLADIRTASTPSGALSTFAVAQQFLAAGYSLVAIRRDGTKRPAVAWKQFQSRLPTESEIKGWFDGPAAYGIALIHGRISGNSEVIDVDHAGVGDEFYIKARHEVPGVEGAPWVQTPRPGYQLFYRLTNPPPGNLKLAEHPNPDWTEGSVGISRWTTIVETRGEGGYTVTMGSPPQCHPTGRCYRLMFGSFRTVPVLTAEERNRLHAIAASHDRRLHNDHVGDHRQSVEVPTANCNGTGLRPGDDFARHVSWDTILTRHGWMLSHTLGGVGYWTRPGKKPRHGHSATTNYAGLDLLYVFSASAAPFEPGRIYNKFTAFALLEHGGDFKAATKALVALGYGGREK